MPRRVRPGAGGPAAAAGQQRHERGTAVRRPRRLPFHRGVGVAYERAPVAQHRPRQPPLLRCQWFRGHAGPQVGKLGGVGRARCEARGSGAARGRWVAVAEFVEVGPGLMGREALSEALVLAPAHPVEHAAVGPHRAEGVRRAVRPAAGAVRIAGEHPVGVGAELPPDHALVPLPGRVRERQRPLACLVAVGADEDGDVGEPSGAHRDARRDRQFGDAGHGQRTVQDATEVAPGGQHLLWPLGPQTGHGGRGVTAARGGGVARAPRSGLRGRETRAPAALDDGAVEQTAGRGRGQEGAHRLATGRLARERHAAGIPTERGDVPLGPAQRRLLVEQAVVARTPLAQPGQVEEAEHAEPVVDRDDHDVVGPREQRAVVEVARTAHEAPAVDPEQHRQRVVRAPFGGVDVEVEAVLTRARAAARRLLTARTGTVRRPDTRPRGRGRPPAQAADRWRGVRDAEEPADPVRRGALDHALVGGHRQGP